MLHPDIKKPHSVFQYTYTQILRNPTVCSNIPSPRYKENPQGVPIFLTKPETFFFFVNGLYSLQNKEL